MGQGHVDGAVIETAAFDRVVYERTADGVVLTAPGARNAVWNLAALFYGVPWLVALVAASVWYLGWGIPDNPLVRFLLWLTAILLTFAMHLAALLSLWGAIYYRTGVEEIVIDADRITVVRRAGRIPIRLHINRSISEQVYQLPPHKGSVARPRIEVKSLRSAIRFGAGLTHDEAKSCVQALSRHFEQTEAERDRRVDPHASSALPSHLRHRTGDEHDQGDDGDE